jgi:protein ImuA
MAAASARSSAIHQLRNQLTKSQNSGLPQQFLSTGTPGIDAVLPNRGLPTGAVIEWISDQAGQSAASIALSLSGGLMSQPGCLAVIDSRCEFNADAVCSVGVPMSRLLLIRQDHKPGVSLLAGGDPEFVTGNRRSCRSSSFLRSLPVQQADTLWALEQTARCPGVRVAMCWLDRVSSTALRRLQLAVERSGVTVFLIRPDSALRQSSWADLRIGIRGLAAATVQIQVIQARNQVQNSSVVQLTIDHETGVVRPLSQLADSATPA